MDRCINRCVICYKIVKGKGKFCSTRCRVRNYRRERRKKIVTEPHNLVTLPVTEKKIGFSPPIDTNNQPQLNQKEESFEDNNKRIQQEVIEYFQKKQKSQE